MSGGRLRGSWRFILREWKNKGGRRAEGRRESLGRAFWREGWGF